jgi:hypothetical protein
MLRIVRTGDGYRREHVSLCATRAEARFELEQYRLADPAGYYEIIKYRKRKDD